ncbi:MAG: hypothetical protein NTW72_06160 [Gemmatimonadetes bacterium]|nr:hypothetical protein [Gemmatimonadota bacterium]
MRRLLPVLSLLAVVHGAAVHVAAAQMPPSIKKPIEMARKNAAARDREKAERVAQARSPAKCSPMCATGAVTRFRRRSRPEKSGRSSPTCA